MFTANALNDLVDRTEYETWLLEAIYQIAEDKLIVTKDGFVYAPDGSPPTLISSGGMNIDMGDWRPGFLKAGAPLVLVTAFKTLDMILEWILVENGRTSSHKFAQKIQDLKSPQLVFPPAIAQRVWLQDRLIALYEKLTPLRGTLIHARQFVAADGELLVAATRPAGSPVVHLGSSDLRNLALIVTSVVHYLDGTWVLDAFRERRLRKALDEVAALHGLPSLNQLTPNLVYVRVFRRDDAPIEVDLDAIRSELSRRQPDIDHVLRLRIVVVSEDGLIGRAFLLREDQLVTPQLRRNLLELAPFEVSLPSDVSASKVASALPPTVTPPTS